MSEQDAIEKVNEIVAEQATEEVAPIGVTLKEGLTEEFIRLAKKMLKNEPKEETPEDLKKYAEFLKKSVGSMMASYLCRLDSTKEFNQWVSGKEVPEYGHKAALIRAKDIVMILLSKMTYKQVQDWFINPNEYLGRELPMDVMQTDPEFVRKAALWDIQ